LTKQELIELLQPVELWGTLPDRVQQVQHDSRAVQPGDIYVALRGHTHDGHTFISDTLKSGAAVIIAEEQPSAGLLSKLADTQAWIQVENTRAILGPLAQALVGWPAKKLTMIGVTGTNGKTTVATLLYQALSKLGKQVGLLSTVRKYIGDQTMDSRLTTSDPVELAEDLQAMVYADCEYAVMEVSSHALDQQRVAGIDFNYGIFTNISLDHLDYHGSMEAYQEAKALLFRSLDEGAVAIINADDEAAPVMQERCEARIIRYGQNDSLPNSERFIVHQNSAEGLTFEIDGQRISSPMIGLFNAYNLAAVYHVLLAEGWNSEQIAEALGQCPGAEGRLQRVQLDGAQGAYPQIFVDYAHTPDALENVLETLDHTREEGQTLHVVFGCGGDRDRSKRPKMAAIAERLADVVWVTSDNPRTEDPDAIIDEIMTGFTDPKQTRIHRMTSRELAIQSAIAEADAKSLVLIAGKGHETYQEINGERHHFDDREIAREALLKHTSQRTNGEVA
jgi:UDP-N-acetylmuramoyl-L-alanyl-D-glutamate--2,6-diaminopimelate ligase